MICGSGGCLPHPAAPTDRLEAVGLAVAKSIIDDHPLGHGFCGFVLDFLVHGDESEVLRDVGAALHALGGYDRALADGWRALLALEPAQVAELGMAFEDFDATAAADVPVTPHNLRDAVLLSGGCGFDQTVKVWSVAEDVAAGQEHVATLEGHEETVVGVALAPSGPARIVSVSYGFGGKLIAHEPATGAAALA